MKNTFVRVLSIALIGSCAVAHANPINLLRSQFNLLRPQFNLLKPQLLRAAKIALVTTAGATTASSWAGYYQGYQTVAKKNDGIYTEFDEGCVDRSLKKAFVILAPVYAFKKLANPLVKIFKESYEVGYHEAQLEKVRRGEYDKVRIVTKKDDDSFYHDYKARFYADSWEIYIDC